MVDRAADLRLKEAPQAAKGLCAEVQPSCDLRCWCKDAHCKIGARRDGERFRDIILVDPSACEKN